MSNLAAHIVLLWEIFDVRFRSNAKRWWDQAQCSFTRRSFELLPSASAAAATVDTTRAANERNFVSQRNCSSSSPLWGNKTWPVHDFKHRSPKLRAETSQSLADSRLERSSLSFRLFPVKYKRHFLSNCWDLCRLKFCLASYWKIHFW